jgi:hypothetical protein
MASYPAITTVLSRRNYGTFAFWRVPERIDYCGRRYYPDGMVDGPPRSFMARVSGNPSWKTGGHTFTLHPIEASVAKRSAASEVCAMTVYVPTGTARFAQYVLSGGP